MSKVSVIVPVYNNEIYIHDCLDSLLQQTLQDIEIIVVDDASIDGSLKIVQQYAKQYPQKIKVIQNKKNIGLSASRNKGVALATGEYIGFVDSDDFVHSEMYDDLYYAAQLKNFPEIISTGILEVDSSISLLDIDNQSIRRGGKLYHLPSNPNYLYWESPSCCNKLFRRDTIEKQPFLENKIWEDVAFTYSQMIKANHIISFNNHDYYYRRHQESGIMASCYKVNPHLLDIFDINDTLTKVALHQQCYSIFEKQIKLIQNATCLQRMQEVAHWNIDEPIKKEIINKLDDLSCAYYGNWRYMNPLILQSKVNMADLESFDLMNRIPDESISPADTKKQLQKQLLSL